MIEERKLCLCGYTEEEKSRIFFLFLPSNNFCWRFKTFVKWQKPVSISSNNIQKVAILTQRNETIVFCYVKNRNHHNYLQHQSFGNNSYWSQHRVLHVTAKERHNKKCYIFFGNHILIIMALAYESSEPTKLKLE